MFRSLYDGAATLHVLDRQHQATANNLANINSGGFRRAEFSVIESRGPQSQRNRIGNGPQIEKLNIDFSQGRLIETGRTLDVAIFGDGFFEMETPNGQTVYSKNGRFVRRTGADGIANGTLQTDTGLTVMGQNGPIVIPPSAAESEIQIGPDGAVRVGDTEIGKLQITAFEDNSTLVPLNQSVFQASARSNPVIPETEVRQKFFEASNINPTSELVSLIVGGRLYEAVQKATTTISRSLEQSVRA